MIANNDLKSIANDKLLDAEVLLNGSRFDGAVYVCGYAVEVALKFRICRTLNWPEFPSTRKDFENYRSLGVHDLDVLLSFTGLESTVKGKSLYDWSVVSKWDPEKRYELGGRIGQQDAQAMIDSTKNILKYLL